MFCISTASLALYTSFYFFFNDTATTEIYTLSLHDALPISAGPTRSITPPAATTVRPGTAGDRKSTRLNSSHTVISYAVFCLKKKNNSCDACLSFTELEVFYASRVSVLRQEVGDHDHELLLAPEAESWALIVQLHFLK